MESASVVPATQPVLYLPYVIVTARSLNVVVVDIACVSVGFLSLQHFLDIEFSSMNICSLLYQFLEQPSYAISAGASALLHGDRSE